MRDRSALRFARRPRTRTARLWIAWAAYMVGTVLLLVTMLDGPYAHYLAAQLTLFFAFLVAVASAEEWGRLYEVLATFAWNVRWRWQEYRRGPVSAQSPISTRLRELQDDRR